MQTTAFSATQDMQAPLERARIALTGTATVYDDPADLLHEGDGARQADVELDTSG